MDARRHQRQFGIAFIGDGAHRAAIGDEEVGARYADIRAQHPVAQFAPGAFGHGGDAVFLMRRAMFHLEEGRHLFARLVHGGPDDVRRALVGQLDDMFGQVGFDPADPGLRQGVGQADFLPQHGFGAGDGLGA